MAAYVLSGNKWGAGGYGSPGGQVTWSFAAANYGDQHYQFDYTIPDFMKVEIREAFARWESVARIDFVEVVDGRGSDIRLGLDDIDGAGRFLGEAWTTFQPGNPGHLTAAEIVFDFTGENWRTSGQTVVNGSGADLFTVALHEIGHAIGLDHAEGQPEVMNAITASTTHDLFPGDVAGARALYGDPNAPHLNAVFRFFETTTGEHFYTTSTVERDQIVANLKNFSYEGAQWATPDAGAQTQDVFRFYSTLSNTHFYTTSAAEKDAILATLPHYRFEGVAFQTYADGVSGDGVMQLERFFNTASGVHHYAVPPGEVEGVRQGSAGPNWADEGASLKVHVMTADLLV